LTWGGAAPMIPSGLATAGPLSRRVGIRQEREQSSMARRTRSLRELRAEVEAAEARGLMPKPEARPRREPAEPARPKPQVQPRLKVVWNVCDVGGRTVATFEYPARAEAEALATQLKARGKGPHFVRSEKVPMG
jgi:HAMP domain-containing protein